MGSTLTSNRPILQQTNFPESSIFAKCCQQGLSAIYPFKSGAFADPHGWKFQARWPPSYSAFGRMRSLLAIHDALILKPRRVLEVAAGGGGLAATLANQGCQVTVNDLREEEVVEALKEYSNVESIKVSGGNMFELSPDYIGKFDLVIACDVIEHVAYPLNLLEHLKKFLEPKGRILLTTPNGSYFRNKLPTYSEISDFTELESRQFMPDADGHLFLLTPQELSNLASVVGLNVERLNAWGTPLLSGHVGLRYISNRFFVKATYGAELLMQRLPLVMRERLCVALSTILQLP
jgi:2-polyprenyl-6-hydroxyphenyl methylase/3-demethylubiquinone-9 3-methyltransferase